MQSKELTGEHKAQVAAKDQAMRRLMHELEKGRRSGDERGWIPIEEVEHQLDILSKQS